MDRGTVTIPLEEYDMLRQTRKDYEALAGKTAREIIKTGHYVHKTVVVTRDGTDSEEDLERALELAARPRFQIMTDEEVVAEARQELVRLGNILALTTKNCRNRGDIIRKMEQRSLWQRIVNKRVGPYTTEP